MSVESAYRLRQRGDAAGFARAWDAALAQAIARLSDAALSRALHGAVTPIFYKGEQIGERRRFDENLTRFLRRSRAPQIYKPLPANAFVQTIEDAGVAFDRAKEFVLDPDAPLPSLHPENDNSDADGS